MSNVLHRKVTFPKNRITDQRWREAVIEVIAAEGQTVYWGANIGSEGTRN